jgi:glycosyltransferase involved in cell wall biosynthesis
MKILVATDAWHPQVNGVVRTLSRIAEEAPALGARIEFLTPDQFWNVALPNYREIRLALPRRGKIEERFAAISPQAVHVATEGPIGIAVRAYCREHKLPFTTSFHTRFPDYLASRLPLPPTWTRECTWAWLRRFHSAASATLAPTPTLGTELKERGFHNITLWSRGVDTELFKPREGANLGRKRPVFLNVGRLAVEKNLEAFLKVGLPGTKVVVGDGPARATLMRQFPEALFLGPRHGEDLARIYAAADVFVFPSRTDTFGLVLLEALASGLPIAAFPAIAPRDVIGDAPVGVLNDDLRAACLQALKLPRAACREFVLKMTWKESAQCFLDNICQTASIRTL